MSWIVDGLGWVGMVLYVVAYFLVSSGRLTGRSRTFQGLNIAAAVLVAINAGYYRAYPSCAVNVVWFLIGVLTVGGLLQTPTPETHQGLPRAPKGTGGEP